MYYVLSSAKVLRWIGYGTDGWDGMALKTARPDWRGGVLYLALSEAAGVERRAILFATFPLRSIFPPQQSRLSYCTATTTTTY